SGCGDRATGACADGAASCTVGERAEARGVFVGAAFVQGNSDPEFRTTLVEHFNSTTAPLYWESTQPRPGELSFAIPDEVVTLAEAAGLRVRGHPLVWGRLGLPAWVREIDSADEMRATLRAHLAAVLGRYRGRIAQYDAVNEPITFLGADEGTGGLDGNVFHRLLGPTWVREVLELVHELDPDAELYVNEFGVMTPGPKQDRFHALVRELVEQGAPIDGVGFQGHVGPPFLPDYDPTVDQIEAAIRRFTGLGLRVEITEVDVTIDPGEPGALERQAETYRRLALACFGVPGCRGLTTWGVTDKHTWIRDFFRVEGAPLLFDAGYAPKFAYEALRATLGGLLRERAGS
ncbi:MAG: endo-1,4-beta-xylanase, partial [Thermodesulfobacteriota bacterium]